MCASREEFFAHNVAIHASQNVWRQLSIFGSQKLLVETSLAEGMQAS